MEGVIHSWGGGSSPSYPARLPPHAPMEVESEFFGKHSTHSGLRQSLGRLKVSGCWALVANRTSSLRVASLVPRGYPYAAGSFGGWLWTKAGILALGVSITLGSSPSFSPPLSSGPPSAGQLRGLPRGVWRCQPGGQAVG